MAFNVCFIILPTSFVSFSFGIASLRWVDDDAERNARNRSDWNSWHSCDRTQEAFRLNRVGFRSWSGISRPCLQLQKSTRQIAEDPRSRSPLGSLETIYVRRKSRNRHLWLVSQAFSWPMVAVEASMPPDALTVPPRSWTARRNVGLSTNPSALTLLV